MDATFANRLANARKIKGMSLRELSAHTQGQISHAAIGKYEKAQMMPSNNTLKVLAKALNVKLDYFFRPFAVAMDAETFEFRECANLGAKEVESIKYQVCAEIEKYLEIEKTLEEAPTFVLDYSDVLVKGQKEAKLLAKRFKSDLSIGTEAIVSTIELLETCGLKIIEIEYDDKFTVTSNTAGEIPVIVINKQMTAERKRITLLQELGHLLMRCAEGVDQEEMCAIFANEILISSEKLIHLIGATRHNISLVELQAIQRQYGVTVDALMAKAAELSIITQRSYTSYLKKKKEHPAFQKMVDVSLYPIEQSNRFKRLVYRALASEVISLSKAASLLETSIEEVRDAMILL